MCRSSFLVVVAFSPWPDGGALQAFLLWLRWACLHQAEEDAGDDACFTQITLFFSLLLPILWCTLSALNLTDRVSLTEARVQTHSAINCSVFQNVPVCKWLANAQQKDLNRGNLDIEWIFYHRCCCINSQHFVWEIIPILVAAGSRDLIHCY